MARKTSTRKSAKAEKRSAGKPRQDKPDREERAQGRPVWSGTLRLALVSVPVKLYSATRSGAHISFHQVHKPSGKRIRYQKIAPGVGPVDAADIVKGFELEDGQYVLLEPEEVEDVKLETKHTIDLVQFVAATDIDPIWFDRPYFVVADGEVAEEAYRVLRDAMRESGRIGLGQFVMRGREYIGAIKPCGNGLLLETLRFADEVRDAAPFFAEVSDEPADEELLGLAEELIERKAAPFQPGRFQDHYTEALRALIDAKAKHRKPVQIEEEAPAHGAKVIDLVDALKRSVRGGEGGKPTGRSSGSRRKAG